MIELYRASQEPFINCFVGTLSDRGYEKACLHIQLQNYDILVVIQQRCQQQSIARLSVPHSRWSATSACKKRGNLHEALSSALQPTWQSTADVSSMQQMCGNGGPQSSKYFDHSTELLVTVR